MATFTPPTVADGPRTIAAPHPGNALMRHYTPLVRGVNVFYLTDGTVTTVEPWDATRVHTVWHGGHTGYTVNAAQAAALTAAGYGAYIA